MVVIEHNLDVIKTADWLIDMGPEGGTRGGLVVAEGTPEQIALDPHSYTGEYLRPLLMGREVPVGDAQPVLVADPVSNGKRGQKAVKKTVRKTNQDGDRQDQNRTRSGRSRQLNARATDRYPIHRS